MLGHLRRTTRTDVALALTSAGVMYLAWVLACWVAKTVAASLQSAGAAAGLPAALVHSFGSWAVAVFDLAGPVWMIGGLWLVIRASRQRRVISWSWLLIAGQGLGAILIAAWAALAARQAISAPAASDGSHVPPVDWSPALVAVGVVIWVSTLVWLILDRAKLRRRGPVSADGFRTHAYRR